MELFYMKETFLRLERLALKPFEAIFHFLSRTTTYTFALAFTTSIGGFLIAAYIAVFLSGTLRFEESGTWLYFLYMFTGLSLFLYAPGYYIHFGLLYRIGIPCFSKDLNLINTYIKKNGLMDPRGPQDAQDLLKALEKLPNQNMKAALIYPSIVLAGSVTLEAFIGSSYNAIVMAIGIASAIFIYVFTTYIAAELLTGPMRRKVKKYLVEKKISFDETATFSIRNKFRFINGLILIAMIELGLMFYYSATREMTLLQIVFIILTVLMVGSLLFFYLISIENSLYDIEAAAMDLAQGGAGMLFLRGLDRELVNTGQGFISAAREVNEIRSDLEEKVRERTHELNSALEELEMKNSLIHDELHVASRIQQGILPDEAISINGLNIVCYHQSMEQIGGDFYDIIPMRNNTVGILMADVSGHGIPAALVTMMAKITFTEATRHCLSPKRIFFDVNQSMGKVIQTEEYLTAFFMVVSSTYDVLYSNASHRPALRINRKTGEIDQWDTDGLFIGAFQNKDVGTKYEEKIDQLRAGDRVFLFTDGLVEARNESGEEFGDQRLKDLLKNTMDMSLEHTRSHVLKEWKSFLGNVPINDDMSFLVIELTPVSHEAAQLREEGRALLQDNKPEEAMETLQKALTLNSQDSLTLQMIGHASIQTGQYDEAVRYLKSYVEKKQEDPMGLYLLAVAQYNLQDYGRALINASTAVQLNQRHIPSLKVMAKSLDHLTRYEEAHKIWQTILDLQPDDQEARSALDE